VSALGYTVTSVRGSWDAGDSSAARDRRFRKSRKTSGEHRCLERRV